MCCIDELAHRGDQLVKDEGVLNMLYADYKF